VIDSVVIIVVVAEEIQPVLEQYQPVLNEQLTSEFVNLAVAYSAKVQNSNGEYTLTVLKVGESEIYHRHNSGYSQSAAIAALAVKILHPDLIVSFGTAGGTISSLKYITRPGLLQQENICVGDIVLGSGCVFIDRFRTSSKNSFDWGVFGGTTMLTKKLQHDLGFKTGLLGSQSSYKVTEEQAELMKLLHVVALDMEAAPEAQILQQTK
jgi:nucleoside phosphorylase